ncbi:MAG: helix-turn-helix transcriptional regulator [Planctomycetota bacterium]
MDTHAKSDRAILRDLGGRLRRVRLEKNVSQRRVAELAGLSRLTVGNLERGVPSSLLTLLQVLRALGSLDALYAFLPDPGPSPIELAKRRGRMRRRASREPERPESERREEASW